MSTLKVNSLQDTSGNGYYPAKAWVNFNGDDDPITIRDDANVSSITDNGTGNYTVNLTSAVSSSNFCANCNISETDLSAARLVMLQPVNSSSCIIQCDQSSGAAQNVAYVLFSLIDS